MAQRGAETAPGAADLAALRALPSLLLREGYCDALAGLDLLDGPGRARALARLSLPPPLQLLLAVFALGQPVAAAALAEVLPPADLAALRRLGVLLQQDDQLHTAGLALLPWLGHLLVVPIGEGAHLYLSDDTVALGTRLVPPRGARCLDLSCGAGALTLRLASLTGRVVALDENPVAAAYAELALALNGLEDRAEIRCVAVEALQPHEAFDFVAACPPVLPFSPALALHGAPPADDGQEPLRRLLRRLPALLRRGALAQIVASGLGDRSGPRISRELADSAEQHRLQIAMTVADRVRMCPGDRLFELAAQRCAALAGVPVEAARRRLLEHLAATQADHLHRYFLAIQRGGPRPGLHVTT